MGKEKLTNHGKREIKPTMGKEKLSQPWEKRNSTSNFDVTTGSYDGAETCELVGCYLLSQLKQIPGIEIGLYRDDGLAVLNQTPLSLIHI